MLQSDASEALHYRAAEDSTPAHQRAGQGFAMPQHATGFVHGADGQRYAIATDPRRPRRQQHQQQQRLAEGSPTADPMHIDQPGSLADSPSSSGHVQVTCLKLCTRSMLSRLALQAFEHENPLYTPAAK